MRRMGWKSYFTGLLMVCLMVSLCAGAASAAPTAPVEVDGGALVGTVENGIRTYLGIPFAAPPVDDLRWKAPQPVVSWQGVRQATQFAPSCMQSVDWVPRPWSEDCLYLNVWSPAKADKPLPVMVWIHAGNFIGGSGSSWGRDGGVGIARRGVILVTINYRVGVFGFFAHPELSAASPNHSSGNQGLLDQIAALTWVKRNIAAFGGDPDNVTIAGESAGGASVELLMTSPLAKGLFHRAIAESGVTGMLPHLKTAEEHGSTFVLAHGGRLAGLQALPADQLAALPWTPWPDIDGYAIPLEPEAVFRSGHQAEVPLLLGWNADSGADLAHEIFGTENYTAAGYVRLLKEVIGSDPPAALLEAYPGNSDAEARNSIHRLTTDLVMGAPTFLWASLVHASQSPVYLYYFIHKPAEPKTSCAFGCEAGLGAEVRFAFDQLANGDREWTADDRMIADRMARYWTNFAKNGDPNGDDVPAWPAFDGRDDTVQHLGTEAEIAARGAIPDFRQNARGDMLGPLYLFIWSKYRR